jgi:hypothetical protein
VSRHALLHNLFVLLWSRSVPWLQGKTPLLKAFSRMVAGTGFEPVTFGL